MLRAVIIDDEQSGVVTLQLLIEKHTREMRVVASANHAEEGIRIIEDYEPDVVFLDISMPGLSGFELLDKLHYKLFKLVFVTAHREYALQAIKSRAFDYLLKPIVADDFIRCMKDLGQAIQLPAENKKDHASLIELHMRDGIVYIRQEEIIRIEASGSYSVFHLDNQVRHTVSKGLKEYESHLNHHHFFRCHHSHIVNLNKVNRFVNSDGLFAEMMDGSRALISRRHKDLFLERIKSL